VPGRGRGTDQPAPRPDASGATTSDREASAPTADPPTTAVLHPGDVLAGRYRLEDAVVDSLDGGLRGSALWRAVDEVLARPVALKALPAAGRAGAAAARPFLQAAGRASALAHPGLARVYDAAVEERRSPARRGPRSADVAYVVSEWVDGRPLSELLADGPLDPAEAVRLAVQACEAVAAAHARGIAHGRLHLGSLHVTPAGRLVVTDTAVAAAVDGRDTSLDGVDDATRAALVADDTRDLAAAAYALLTGRWPGDATPQPAEGVPAAPGRDRRTYSPRQVRAAVPRELDALVTRALLPPGPGDSAPRTPAALGAALARVAPPPAQEERVRTAPDVARPPSRWRRALPWVAAVAFVTAFASGTYALGRTIGKVPGQDVEELEALVQPTPSASPGAARPVRIPLDRPGVTVRDFDPQGSDRSEQPSQVANATDGDLTTAWLTSVYKSERFGGLKQGVGLLVDLGARTPVTRVDVALTNPGADLEVRVADDEPDGAGDLRTVARRADAPTPTRLGLPAGTTARYVLVWITSLPEEDGGRFRTGVDELVLVR
jgi:hypothetical protein